MSPDTHALEATARRFGWRVVWELDGSARMLFGGRTLRVFFDADGAFSHGRANGPGSGTALLTMTDVVAALEAPREPEPQSR